MQVDEPFRTLYFDPGEDFGWCQGRGTKLLAAGTEKMWTMADDVWTLLGDGWNALDHPLNSEAFLRSDATLEELTVPVGRIVCEDFKIYPKEARMGALDWDPVRTARVIGAITFMCRLHGVPLILQGADIKKAAQAAGAEELYYRPLKENRHQNDAIQHFVFFTNVELMQIPLLVPDSVHREDFS